MTQFKISPVQWGAGGYCAFNGLLMLVTPHQFLSPSYAALQPQLWLWGLLFLLSGSYILGVALLHLPRRTAIIAHVLAGASLLLLAAGFVASQLWSGTINLSVLGLGTLLAGFSVGADAGRSLEDRARSSRDLLSLLVGLGMIANGLLMLLAPAQYSAPLYTPVRPFLMWFGLAFVLGGALLAYWQLRPAPQRGTASGWIAHLLGGAILFSFLPLVIIGQIWSGIPYYGVIAVLVALAPWQNRMWRIDSGTLRIRLALAMGLVAAVPLILMTAWFSDRSEQEMRQVALANNQTLATALASSVQNYANEHRNAVHTLAANPDLMSLSLDKQRAFLQVPARSYPDIVAFSTYDLMGMPIARSDNLTPTALLPELLTSIHTAGGPIDAVIMSPLLHRPVFVFGAPSVRQDGRLSGYILVTVESARVSAYLEKSNSSAGGIVYLVDSTGRVIAHPDQTLVAGLANLRDKAPVAAFLKRPDGSGALNYGTPATERLAGYAHVPGLGWGVIVEQPVATALAATRTARQQLLVLVLVFLVLAAAAGVLVARGMTAPLSDLVAATTAMSRNEQSAPLPASGISDLDRLADAFGTMRERVAVRTAELTSTNLSLLREIETRTQTERALWEGEERYSSVIASLEEGVVLQNLDGSFMAINGSAERILGIPLGQMLGLRSFYTPLRAIHEDGTLFTPEEDPTSITLHTRLPCSHVIVGIHRPDSRLAWLSVNSQPLLRPGETEPYAVVSSLTDITERKQAEEALHEMATRDPLTNLFNRREMMRILNDETGRFRRYGHPASIVMLDVDHFKRVNDIYGHQIGDEVLQWVAKVFQESLRETDHAVRYGGEEFAAILPDTGAVGAMQVAERLRRGIATKPFTSIKATGDEIEIPVTISLGIAEIAGTVDGLSAAEALIAKADKALYQAKRSGRNQTVSFDQLTLADSPVTAQEKAVGRPAARSSSADISSHRGKGPRLAPKLEPLVMPS